MDYKDLVIVGFAVLGGLVGLIGGLPGWIAGTVVGAGVGAVWAYDSDVRKYLRERDEGAE